MGGGVARRKSSAAGRSRRRVARAEIASLYCGRASVRACLVAAVPGRHAAERNRRDSGHHGHQCFHQNQPAQATHTHRNLTEEGKVMELDELKATLQRMEGLLERGNRLTGELLRRQNVDATQKSLRPLKWGQILQI